MKSSKTNQSLTTKQICKCLFVKATEKNHYSHHQSLNKRETNKQTDSNDYQGIEK